MVIGFFLPKPTKKILNIYSLSKNIFKYKIELFYQIKLIYYLRKISLTLLLLLLVTITKNTYSISKANFTLSVSTENFFYVDHNNFKSSIGSRAYYNSIKIKNASGLSQKNIAIKLDKYTDATRSEYNNNYIAIERITDGKTFEKIRNVNESENSSIDRNYSIIDENPEVAVNYYQLIQTEFDGQKTYSKLVAVNYLREKLPDIKIYPNPTDDNFSNDFSQIKSNQVLIQIYDINGELELDKTMHSSVNKTQTFFNLHRKPKGEYYIYYSSDKIYSCKKILTQKN
jgi:hypothetical protein